jgi:hypothetical protein
MAEETRESGLSGTATATSTSAGDARPLKKGIVLGKDGKP